MKQKQIKGTKEFFDALYSAKQPLSCCPSPAKLLGTERKRGLYILDRNFKPIAEVTEEEIWPVEYAVVPPVDKPFQLSSTVEFNLVDECGNIGMSIIAESSSTTYLTIEETKLLIEFLTAQVRKFENASPANSLPSETEVRIEAKRYEKMMNRSGNYNPFHEIDFYNGASWVRDKIEANKL